MKHLRYRYIALSILFIGLIIFPLLNQSFKIVRDSENTENRKAASKPKFDISNLDIFPGDYEKYYNDNFTVRQFAIKSFNLLNLVVFKKSPLPDQVVIGRNGWLFMGGNEIDAYRGKNALSRKELEDFKIELEYRKSFLEKMGTKFYFVIAPVKANIYPEYMPINVFRLSKLSWGEQLNDYLNNNSSVKTIDLYKALRLSKSYGLLYRLLDNHWNARGAFLAVNEILNTVSKDIPDIHLLNFSDFKENGRIVKTGNIVSMLSNTTIFSDSIIEYTPKKGFKAKTVKKQGYPIPDKFAYKDDFEKDREIFGSDKPKLLLISDSFGGYAFPFIAENFSRSVKIFDAWQYKLNADIVKSEKPDVVILMVLESNLRGFLRYKDQGK